MERAGLPAAHICTVTLVALMVGSNRIVPASSIVHPVGNAALEPAAEKSLRRVIVDKALQSLQAEVQEQTLFAWPR